MKFSRALQLAVGSAAIVWMVVIVYFHGPPWPALVGAVGAILWLAIKAWRERPGASTSVQRKTENQAAGSDAAGERR